MANDSNFTWELKNHIVLLPTGVGEEAISKDPWSMDGVRCTIEQLGGQVAYARPPVAPWSHNGPQKSEATHEYVPQGQLPLTQLPILSEKALRVHRTSAHLDLADFFSKYRRPTFIPSVNECAASGIESRYFGKPWMPQDLNWPELAGVPMQFVLQLDTTALPGDWSKLIPQGLLLFFHAEEYDDKNQSRILLVNPKSPGGIRETPIGVFENTPLQIAKWNESHDFPWGETLRALPGFSQFESVAIGFGSNEFDVIKATNGQEYPAKVFIEQGHEGIGHTFACDKISGWPCWRYGDDTPTDQNGEKMRFFMQVGLEGLRLGNFAIDNIKWPIYGRGQIFFSEKTGEFKFVYG